MSAIASHSECIQTSRELRRQSQTFEGRIGRLLGIREISGDLLPPCACHDIHYSGSDTEDTFSRVVSFGCVNASQKIDRGKYASRWDILK